jgi:hypothetical protein
MSNTTDKMSGKVKSALKRAGDRIATSLEDTK